MTDLGDSLVSDSPSETHTLGQLHLRAERRNVRRAVMQHWAATRWQETPPWRFYRQVIRVGLYLRERLGVEAGDRVVVLSPLRPERIVADWAGAVQGAVMIAVDSDLPSPALASTLGELAPKAVFVTSSSERARLLELQGRPVAAEKVVVFDSEVARPPTGDASPSTELSWSEVLDLGGTLDTAERAQKFRARARAVEPEAPAIAVAEKFTNGSPTWKYLSHAEVVGQIARFRLRSPSREGDLAYVVGDKVSLPALVAVWAFVGDGQTILAFGTPGREAEQIAELRPHRILAPRQVVEHAARTAPVRARPGTPERTWMGRVHALASLKRWIRPAGDDPTPADRLRDMMTLDGTRVEPKNRTTGDAQ
jgi:hypothetical protein